MDGVQTYKIYICAASRNIAMAKDFLQFEKSQGKKDFYQENFQEQ